MNKHKKVEIEDLLNGKVTLFYLKNKYNELVERATPKKPYLQDDEDDILLCPTCNEDFIDNHISNYCPNCGQALDWSDE